MYRKNRIGVVIPAYNEAGFIGDVIKTVPEYVDRIYVVDDASMDTTWEEAMVSAWEDEQRSFDIEIDAMKTAISDGGQHLIERAEMHRNIGRTVLFKHHENKGAGGAIKTGYLAAILDDIDIVVTMDGDGQMDPSYMSKLLDPIVEGDVDYAKGNRLVYKEYREKMPQFRLFGNSILTFLTKIASGYWKTMDPQNGYTAISKYALENVGVEALYEYYGYCNDLLVRLNAKGMRIADVGMPAMYSDEESNIQYPTYIRRVSAMLLRNFLWRLKTRYLVLDFHPLAFFYLFGIITASLGILGGLWSFYATLTLNSPFFVRGSLSLLLFLIGSLFLMFAMLFDMQVNEDREVQIYD